MRELSECATTLRVPFDVMRPFVDPDDLARHDELVASLRAEAAARD